MFWLKVVPLITNLSAQLNRPYAMAFTILVFPALVNIFLMHPNSPFRKIMYDYEFEKAYRDPNYQIFDDYKNIHHYDIENAYKSYLEVQKNFIDIITALANTPLFTMAYGSSNGLNFDQIMVKMEDALVTVGELDALNQLKMLLIKCYNSLISAYQGQGVFKNFLSENELKSLSLKKLFETVNKQFEFFLKDFPNKVERAHEVVSEMKARMVMRTNIKIAQIVIAMMVQYFIVDRLLNRFFPHGMFQPRPPETKQWLTKEDATELIKNLNAHHSALKNKAKYNVKIARYVSAFIVPFAMYLISNEEYPSPVSIIFSLTLIATALTNFRQELIKLYENYALESKLLIQENTLKKSIDKSYATLKTFKNESLKSSYFIFKFTEKELSAKKLARIFKDCCLHYRVKIMAQRSKIITLAAQSGIDAQKAVDIRKMFLESVERYKKFPVLINQIKKINALSGCRGHDGVLIKPGIDVNHLPVISIDFIISVEFEDKLNALKSCFANNEISIKEYDQNIYICLNGASPADATQLNYLLSILSTGKKLSSGHASISWNESTRTEYEYKKFKQEKSSEESEISKKPLIQSESKVQSERIIFWKKGGIFNSSIVNNDIYPISLGKFQTAQSFLKTRLFINLKSAVKIVARLT